METYGAKQYRQNKRPGAHLSCEAEPMKRYRAYVNDSVKKKNVNQRLIFYWDQVWVLVFTPEAHIIYKDPAKQGTKEEKAIGNKEAVRMALLREFDPKKYQDEVDKKGDPT